VVGDSDAVCAVLSDGTMQCLGGNPSQQFPGATYMLHNDGYGPYDVYVPIVDHVRHATIGHSNTCVLREDASVFCMGDDTCGQLDDGPMTSMSYPPTALPLAASAQVSMGNTTGCAIDLTGNLKCWGYDGLNGNNYTAYSPVPGVVTSVGAASTGICMMTQTNFACALVDGGVQCFGYNYNGALGRAGGTGLALGAAPVDLLPFAHGLSVGFSHSCALDINGAPWCWGTNVDGELGVDGGPYIGAVQVPGLTGLAAISAGGAHTCALDGDGGVICWGSNMYGQLGAATAFTPVPIPPASQVLAGESLTCALSGSTVYCWGNRVFPQPGFVTGIMPEPTPFPFQ
jgi:alpha-tubulin suppressor-like RCC1 family protein